MICCTEILFFLLICYLRSELAQIQASYQLVIGQKYDKIVIFFIITDNSGIPLHISCDMLGSCPGRPIWKQEFLLLQV